MNPFSVDHLVLAASILCYAVTLVTPLEAIEGARDSLCFGNEVLPMGLLGLEGPKNRHYSSRDCNVD